MQVFQPFIDQAVQYLFGLLLVIVLGLLGPVIRRLQTWYLSHTSVKDREMLHKLGEEGFALAQTAFKEYGGPAKLQEAMAYVNSWLVKNGKHVDEIEIRAAVEKAYLSYRAQSTVVSNTVLNDAPAVPDPVEIPVIPPAAKQLIDAAVAFVQDSQQGTKVPEPAAPVAQTPSI